MCVFIKRKSDQKIFPVRVIERRKETIYFDFDIVWQIFEKGKWIDIPNNFDNRDDWDFIIPDSEIKNIQIPLNL